MHNKERKALLDDFEHWCQQMLDQVRGLEDAQRAPYVFTLVSRFVFLYFLQQQGFLENNRRYLQDKLEQCQSLHIPFNRFLAWLFSAIDTPLHQRPDWVRQIVGGVPYLRVFPEAALPDEEAIFLPDHLIGEILDRFAWFTFDLEELGEEKRVEVTPAILGYLVERFILLQSPSHRKSTGSFYTPEFICAYITEETCYPMIQSRIEELTGRKWSTRVHGRETSLFELIASLDTREIGLLLFVILPTIAILDPALGAGNFLITALRLMSTVYQKIFERIERDPRLQHPGLLQMVRAADEMPGGRLYFARERVLARNLYGIDILQEPLDVSRLRLYLALLNQVPADAELRPLPPLVFSLVKGNSLIGVDRLAERERLQLARSPQYDDLVSERKSLVRLYSLVSHDLSFASAIYARIMACRNEAYQYLNEILTEQIAQPSKGKKRGKKSEFILLDLERLQPFHWAYDLDQVVNHPWWARCDQEEAQVMEEAGRIRVRFGPLSFA